MADQQKMIETRHGLESNPVPTSFFCFIAIIALVWAKKGCRDRVRFKTVPCFLLICHPYIPFISLK